MASCDRLDLFPGRQVQVGLPGREPTSALVTAVVPAPPFAWVQVAGMAIRTAAIFQPAAAGQEALAGTGVGFPALTYAEEKVPITVSLADRCQTSRASRR